MKIDKFEHQKFLLELLAAANYPGQILDLVYEVVQAVKKGEIEEESA